MNPTLDCEQLEAYLVGDLSNAEFAEFEAHLSSCGECRGAVDQQRWINRLLRSPERMALEPAPARLVPRLQDCIAGRRRRLRVGGLAAAVLVAVATWGVAERERQLNRQAVDVSGPKVASQVENAPAVFIGDDDSIVVPMASQYPDIAIVRVYAAYHPDADRETATSDQSVSDEVIEHEPFNGG